MRQQWFTHVRLLIAHPPRYSETSTAALTTPALDRRSLRWFGISACTATPEDLPPSLAQHGSCRRSSTSSSSLPFRTHVGAHNSVVGADQGFLAPSWNQESVRDSGHEHSASAPIAAGQRPRPSFRHPQADSEHEESGSAGIVAGQRPRPSIRHPQAGGHAANLPPAASWVAHPSTPPRRAARQHHRTPRERPALDPSSDQPLHAMPQKCALTSLFGASCENVESPH